MAAAIELGLKPGQILGCRCNCINLLQNYPEGCYANCTYCGLARERPGVPEDNSFIRVAWPLYPTDLVAEKIAEREAKDGVGRVCIAQVQDHRAYDDLVDMTRRVHRAAPEVPLSALVSATTLNEERLYVIKEAGADIIGVGLDGASEEVFYHTRGKGTKGPHTWAYHWHVIRASRRMRRIQLIKYLIEQDELPYETITFNESGEIARLDAPEMMVEVAVNTGLPFMTDGCPDRSGKMACNRPYGSYRPGEKYRDYPFLPDENDLIIIRQQMRLDEVWSNLNPVLA